MKFRKIPGLAQPVSVLCIGSWRTFEKLELEETVAILEACFAAGVNFIDDCRYGTAPGVPPGLPTTEVIVGRALKIIGKPRDSYVLANKLWWDQYPRRSLREQLSKALERLDEERIDLLYVDRPDRLADAHPQMAFQYEDLVCSIATEMQSAMREGLVRAYGFANAKPDAMLRITQITERNHLPAPQVAQIRYSLSEPEASVSPQLGELYRSHRLMLTATTTMAGGILTGKYLAAAAPEEPRRLSAEQAQKSSQALAISRKLSALAAEVGIPAGALAMSFPLLNKAVAAVVFGARSVEQVRENLRALEVDSPELQARIEALAST